LGQFSGTLVHGLDKDLLAELGLLKVVDHFVVLLIPVLVGVLHRGHALEALHGPRRVRCDVAQPLDVVLFFLQVFVSDESRK